MDDQRLLDSAQRDAWPVPVTSSGPPRGPDGPYLSPLTDDELALIRWGGDGGSNVDYDPSRWGRRN